MKNKLKEHYKTSFASSPIEVSESEIDFIISRDCKCNNCNKSIFELYNLPELLRKDESLMCEDCYDEEHRAWCPICEESYDIYDGESEHEVINEVDANDDRKTPGIYHNDKLVMKVRINYFESIDRGCEVEINSDKICSSCVNKMVRKSDFIKSNHRYSLLIKRCEADLLTNHSIEWLHFKRQQMIHRRITCRGLIQEGNK